MQENEEKVNHVNEHAILLCNVMRIKKIEDISMILTLCSIFCCNVMSSMIFIIYVSNISYLFQCWPWLSITVSFDFTCI